jgi:hypothetical protein
MTEESLKDSWATKVEKLLVGKKIVAVRYMTADEQEEHGWYHSAIVIQLDDGTVIYPSQDDEGNDAGALFTTNDDLPIIPVI